MTQFRKARYLFSASVIAITAPLILTSPARALGIDAGAAVGIGIGSLIIGGMLGSMAAPPPAYAYPSQYYSSPGYYAPVYRRRYPARRYYHPTPPYAYPTYSYPAYSYPTPSYHYQYYIPYDHEEHEEEDE
jgi:hypothetical protein